MDFTLLLGPLMGCISTHVFRGSKKVFKFVDRAPAPFQQMGVLALAVGVTWASQWVPYLTEIVAASDPNAVAGIAAATAYGMHRPSR